jgi:hypothetical protein
VKQFFKNRQVRPSSLVSALVLSFLITASLASITTVAIAADSDESPIVQINVGKEKRAIFALSQIPETVSVPVFSTDKNVSHVVEQQLISVSDKKDLFGVVVPTTGGYYGTLVDQSKSEPIYYQLSPTKSVSTKRKLALTQEATELAGSELPIAAHCGNDHADSAKAELVSRELAPRIAKMVSTFPNDLNSWREFELFVVSSSEFSGNRTEENITAQIVATVAAANLFFEPLQLKLKVAGVQILRADNDPYVDAINRLDADQMLKTVKAQWSGNKEIQRDAVVVFGTGNYKLYNVNNSIESDDIFGLAYKATACANPDYSVLFASQGNLTVKGELGLSATLAHELGHSLGMSHDSNLYNQVPSLMYPTYTLNPGGFSDASTKAYLAYAGPGTVGGSCLSPIDTPEIVGFTGGASETISIKEGDTFSRAIKVSGNAQTIAAENLSVGSAFNPSSLNFTFKPGYDIARSDAPIITVRQKFVAKLFDGRTLTKEFVFNVSNVNRAPVISGTPAKAVIIKNVGANVVFSVTDPDGDKIHLSKDTLKAIKRLPGRKNIRLSSKRLTFTWIPAGKMSKTALEFRIADVQGAFSSVKIGFGPPL